MKHDGWGSLLENATAPCEFGDLRARTTVVLMGDSHAEHWLPALDAIGRARGWKVIAMIKPGCPVADVPELASGRLKRTYDECTSWRRSRLARIIAMHPSAVVLSSYNHYVAHGDETGPARGLRRLAIVDMNDRVCPRSPCSVVQNGAIVFRDDDHLTATFSRAQAPVLGHRIEAALRGMTRPAETLVSVAP